MFNRLQLAMMAAGMMWLQIASIGWAQQYELAPIQPNDSAVHDGMVPAPLAQPGELPIEFGGLPIEDPSGALPPAADPHLAAEGAGPACDCGGAAPDASCQACETCIAPCDGSCHLLVAQKRAELKHSCYLKSITAGTAQYAHYWNQWHAQQAPWHGNYYHTQWGRPLALVVPPTAAFQTNWSWGVGRTTVTPIYHQFARPYPGEMSGAAGTLRATPLWPSNTSQFGVYYVRGPW